MPGLSSIALLDRSTDFGDARVEKPVPSQFRMAETILQFGTGAFLRGFSNAFIDQAHRAGTYSGRIVVVGSMGSGRVEAINKQQGLYTLCVQGLEGGEPRDRRRVVGSVSRALASATDWAGVLDLVRSPDLEFVVSNTTEIGIRYDPDDRPDLAPPRSFPGKMTALLHERAQALDHAADAGLIILCCELIEENGSRLRDIVVRLAEQWRLGDRFVEWVRLHNHFCNTLVDRIVPGKPAAEDRERIEEELGYRDDLLVQAEPYGLWAIEGDESLRRRLPFADGQEAIIVTPDIAPYRERKIRILNGAHSLMVPVSYLCGNGTVAETMEHSATSRYVRHVMMQEIVPSLDLDADETRAFARDVLDRFANPFVRHELLSIALQQTSKMDVRVLPSAAAFRRVTGDAPEGIAFGFAAFLMFVNADLAEGLELPPDERSGLIRKHWHAIGAGRLDAFVNRVGSDTKLWHIPWNAVEGFSDAVSRWLDRMTRSGVSEALKAFLEEYAAAEASGSTDTNESSAGRAFQR